MVIIVMTLVQTLTDLSLATNILIFCTRYAMECSIETSAVGVICDMNVKNGLRDIKTFSKSHKAAKLNLMLKCM